MPFDLRFLRASRVLVSQVVEFVVPPSCCTWMKDTSSSHSLAPVSTSASMHNHIIHHCQHHRTLPAPAAHTRSWKSCTVSFAVLLSTICPHHSIVLQCRQHKRQLYLCHNPFLVFQLTSSSMHRSRLPQCRHCHGSMARESGYQRNCELELCLVDWL